MMRHGEAVSVDEPVPVNPPPVEPPAPSPTETTKPPFDIPQPHVSAPSIDVGHVVLIGLVIVGVVVAVYVAVSLVQRWWFRGNEAIILARKQRKKIVDDFGLTIGVPGRDGSFSIAPKETDKWSREGLAGELTSALRPKSGKVLVEFPTPGRVRLRTAVEPSGVVHGECFSDAKSLCIGVSAVDSSPARITQSQTCGYLVVGVPGSGKTVALNALKKAWKNGPRPVKIGSWDGKKDSQSRGLKLLESLKQAMDNRLARDVDAWNGNDAVDVELKVLVVDEADRL
ncbi:ATP-binding protein, partial [Corynebacterium pseudokroppenstedtii]|uniref:ATP-binding protein n=1 Tax=Corynebacterium pseudokroppenstedtii TaxID=2804917 RepID=UPI00254AC988